MFDSTKEDLVDLLEQIQACEIQLPDFQRDWVWDDPGIRSLLASIVRGFPVGAILTLAAGGDIRFKARPLTGVDDKRVPPKEFLLDGQQRLTSLYQSIFSDAPVHTKTDKRKEIERYYYLDIRKTLDPTAHHDDLIVGVPIDRIEKDIFGRGGKLDLSAPEREYENHMFPLNRVFSDRDWVYGWRDYWVAKGERIDDLEKAFVRNVLGTIQRYKMPVIRLDENNSREAICLVFEKVNTGGKKLDAFELLTAVYAADEFNLREDWLGKSPKEHGRLARLNGATNRQDVFKELLSTDFLQACTILYTLDVRQQAANDGKQGRDLPAVTCTKDALLGLPLPNYKLVADKVEEGFRKAGRFINAQKIIWHKDVPYPPQLVALAGAFALLGSKAETAAAQEKLARWFWCGVLAEKYGSATESRISRDVPELVRWIEGSGSEPSTVTESLFQYDRLDSLRIRLSAAYKGIHALLMRSGCRDFISGSAVDLMTFFQDHMDIHHVFPRKWCDDRDIQPKVYNSIVNKTALSALSNRSIGGNAPSVYLESIQKKHGLSIGQLDEILRSHLIEPKHLRADDFEAFYADRKKKLADLISATMQKPVVADYSDEETADGYEDDDEFIAEAAE